MFTLAELQLIRASLDHIMIKGADSKFLSQLQIKVEKLLVESNNTEDSKKQK